MKKSVIIVPRWKYGESMTVDNFTAVEGYSDNRMGIFQQRRCWVVIHIPSGFILHPWLRSIEHARELVEALGPLLPELGELGESPATRMSAKRRELLKTTFRAWLDERGYKHRGITEMVGEPSIDIGEEHLATDTR